MKGLTLGYGFIEVEQHVATKNQDASSPRPPDERLREAVE